MADLQSQSLTPPHVQRNALTVASFLLAALAASGVAKAADVTTHHYDQARTGWNRQETTLTPDAIRKGSFGQLSAIALDEQVDAQPLVVHGLTIAGQMRDAVYVATENNTVYAIDASTSAILVQRNLGNPVTTGPKGVIDCGNNSSVIGVTSTPVIDRESNTLYVMAFLLEGANPAYRLFALDLVSLADKTPPQIVTATSKLDDGSSFAFNPKVSRQRPALTLANGNVYAGFGSFCDHDANITRGWLLGWNAKTLAPLAAAHLNDRRSNAFKNFFLTPIWMSGSGPAADEAGDIYFITGNSDRHPAGSPPPTIDPNLSLQESLVKLTPNLDAVSDFFTAPNMALLDNIDDDFGSGGVLVIPGDQPGAVKHLAAAAGKSGTLFLLDRDNLGHFNPSAATQGLAAVTIGRCWCGQSYYVGADGIGRILSSGNNTLSSWKILTSPTTTLAKEWDAQATLGSDVFQKGFFTTISSNGNAKGSAIGWAVQRPSANPPTLTLWAFDLNDGSRLAAVPAGNWPNTGGAANTVPVVADGRVYVASFKELRIFGLGAPPQPALVASLARRPSTSTARISGTIVEVDGDTAYLRTRNGVVQVDYAEAEQNYKTVTLTPGKAVAVRGLLGSDGVMKAQSIEYAPDSPALWEHDSQ